MRLLKNKEFTRVFVLMAFFCALAFAACIFIDTRAAVVCGALGLCVLIIYYADSRMRYRRMARLAEEVDRVLSGAESINLKSYNEGELSILQSELKKLTVRLREQASELMADKRLLADSIADISHQIRTPLTAVNLLLAALNEPNLSEAKQRELLGDMRRQLSRIDWLVSSLLKLARLDADAVSMNMKAVDLNGLIADALAPITIQMELKEQTAEVKACGTVICDRSWTAEALTNILKNCSEHMGAGTLHISAADNPLYCEIVIRDEGRGIAGADLNHLFERFYRGAGSDKNSVGIGLALCRMIIVKQNGTVKADNAPEGGARFTVRFYKSAV